MLPCPGYCKQLCSEYEGVCVFLNYSFLIAALSALPLRNAHNTINAIVSSSHTELDAVSSACWLCVCPRTCAPAVLSAPNAPLTESVRACCLPASSDRGLNSSYPVKILTPHPDTSHPLFYLPFNLLHSSDILFDVSRMIGIK